LSFFFATPLLLVAGEKNKFDASINTFWLFGHPGKGKGHPKPAIKALDEAGGLTPRSGRLNPGNVPVSIVQGPG
jgi:hypothetical protein